MIFHLSSAKLAALFALSLSFLPCDDCSANVLKLVMPSVLSKKGNTVTPRRSWHTPQLIGEELDAWIPKVAMDSSGNAIAVWLQSDGTRHNIWANRYVAGSGWNTAQLIEDSDIDAADPNIAMSATGVAVVVWEADNQQLKSSTIWANHYDPNSGWSKAESIATNNYDAGDVHVAIDTTGNAVAVWVAYNGSSPHMWASHYEAGSGWSLAEEIERNFDGTTCPDVGIDAEGNAIAIWSQNGNGIYINRYIAGAGWGTAQRIDNAAAGSTGCPKIAVSADGSAFAVWVQHQLGANYKIYSSRYVGGSVWSAAEIIQDNAGNNAYSTQVAMDAAGNALAVWQQWNAIGSTIWFNRHAAGTGWGAPGLIYNDTIGSGHLPSLAMNAAAGDAVVAWERNANGRNYIWASVRKAGKGWSAAQQIEPEGGSNFSQYPCLAVDSTGNALAVWQRGNTGSYSIWAARYE